MRRQLRVPGGAIIPKGGHRVAVRRRCRYRHAVPSDRRSETSNLQLPWPGCWSCHRLDRVRAKPAQSLRSGVPRRHCHAAGQRLARHHAEETRWRQHQRLVVGPCHHCAPNQQYRVTAASAQRRRQTYRRISLDSLPKDGARNTGSVPAEGRVRTARGLRAQVKTERSNALTQCVRAPKRRPTSAGEASWRCRAYHAAKALSIMTSCGSRGTSTRCTQAEVGEIPVKRFHWRGGYNEQCPRKTSVGNPALPDEVLPARPVRDPSGPGGRVATDRKILVAAAVPGARFAPPSPYHRHRNHRNRFGTHPLRQTGRKLREARLQLHDLP